MEEKWRRRVVGETGAEVEEKGKKREEEEEERRIRGNRKKREGKEGLRRSPLCVVLLTPLVFLQISACFYNST